ncbi:uncharacterized protein H6S33_008150 [Morchella sextelata]|uniref:uncharacterized protein n=1 Tax=Morchella sextelata TaxID=1174677 RepID=UPI001D058D21|nr:uncharacterized protein H6S33_008150 [Morchella sextelata]KAH0603146.1 hypothetical protein H6S33_008150 [Morchella sextelata]
MFSQANESHRISASFHATLRMNGPSYAAGLQAINSTGFSTNDDLEAAHYSQQTSPSSMGFSTDDDLDAAHDAQQTSASSTLPESLSLSRSGETDPDDLEYPELSVSPDSAISPEDYWHNPNRNQPEVSFFERFIRYIKRQCHAVVAKVVRKFSTKTRRNSLKTPISTMITERPITNVQTAASITVHGNMRLRPVAMTSGPTVEEVLDTVLPASVSRVQLTREDIANALVDSLRLENFMGYDQRFREIDLAPPAPVHVPGHGNLNEFMTTDTCITNVEAVTPTIPLHTLNTVRLRWLTGEARPAVQEVFNAQLPSIADAVVDSLRLENRSNRDLRYRVVDLAPLAPVHMPGEHLRVSTEVVYGNVDENGHEFLEPVLWI